MRKPRMTKAEKEAETVLERTIARTIVGWEIPILSITGIYRAARAAQQAGEPLEPAILKALELCAQRTDRVGLTFAEVAACAAGDPAIVRHATPNHVEPTPAPAGWTAIDADEAPPTLSAAEAIAWSATTREKYDEMLCILPPADMHRGGFLVGEPMDHRAVDGRPRFSAFREWHGAFYESSRPLSRAEFRAELALPVLAESLPF